MTASIGSVITGGFGPPGSAALVITDGFGIGAAIVQDTSLDTHDGGFWAREYRKMLKWLSAKPAKKKDDREDQVKEAVAVIRQEVPQGVAELERIVAPVSSRLESGAVRIDYEALASDIERVKAVLRIVDQAARQARRDAEEADDEEAIVMFM